MSRDGRVASPLSRLSETEAVGRVIVRHYAGREVRWRVHSFHPRQLRGPYRLRAATTQFTGKPGNRFICLERMDNGSKSQPQGTKVCWSKSYFDTAGGYRLEAHRCPECGAQPEGEENGRTFCRDGHFWDD